MRRTQRGLDRFIFFTDAVAAVAITLLVLPLVDSVNEIGAKGGTLPEWLAENWSRLLVFAISFAITGLFWMLHHRFSELLVDYNLGLIWLNLGWMFTIVCLPLATELLNLDDTGLAPIAYIATMVACSVLTVLMRWMCIREPQLVRDRAAVVAGLRANLVTVALFVVALLVTIAFPAVGTWTLFILLLTPVLTRLFGLRGDMVGGDGAGGGEQSKSAPED